MLHNNKRRIDGKLQGDLHRGGAETEGDREGDWIGGERGAEVRNLPQKHQYYM